MRILPALVLASLLAVPARSQSSVPEPNSSPVVVPMMVLDAGAEYAVACSTRIGNSLVSLSGKLSVMPAKNGERPDLAGSMDAQVILEGAPIYDESGIPVGASYYESGARQSLIIMRSERPVADETFVMATMRLNPSETSLAFHLQLGGTGVLWATELANCTVRRTK